MTKELLNKMDKTANVDDHKVYVVIEGKGKFVNLGEISVLNVEGELTPLKDILIGLNTKCDVLKRELEASDKQLSLISKVFAKEIKNIKKEVGLEWYDRIRTIITILEWD